MNRSEPTSAVPGSVEKIEVFRQRAEQGFPIFHPHDKDDCNGVRNPLFSNIRMRNNVVSEKSVVPVLRGRKNLSE